MKVRIGISLGPAGSPDQFAAAVDSLEQAGVDSLWLPETVYSPVVEPFTGMAFALARTRRLKAGAISNGTTMRCLFFAPSNISTGGIPRNTAS